MATQFDDWLRWLAAAQKGPVSITDMSRGRAFSMPFILAGDWTGSTLRGQIRLYPDAAGDPLATFTVTGPVVADGYSTFTCSLSAAVTAAFPQDVELAGVVQFAVDFLFKPSGGVEDLLCGGTINLLGSITL
ncbi:hypothetical protein [Novosphingobium sp. 9]|uniref:hypothetical protein n=1 Tax=Novosphingobium sp. 9 TaxID=2025349 RepID=UPI0021B5D37C|nr:hypothetical protein [Novosphingobium sp. 9]